MGRRLNISTPTVINTELVPLDESFYLDIEGLLEQWYFDNDNSFAPNRKVTPLIITPVLSVTDKDSGSWYSPSASLVKWYAKELRQQVGVPTYVEYEITNMVDDDTADFVKVGDRLIVKRNVQYDNPLTIRCEYTYIDPRDSGVSYTSQDSVTLTTNRDSEIVYPKISVEAPASQSYNPILATTFENGEPNYNSRFTLKAKADWGNIKATCVASVVDDNPTGHEVITPSFDPNNIDETPGTIAPTIDIRYGEFNQYDQTFMQRPVAGGSQDIPFMDGDAAYINRIKGNTAVWNQLLQEGKLVDMGLPSGTLWASCNIDITQPDDGFAASPFQYECSFFSWGNVDGHNPIGGTAFDYDWGTVNGEEPYYEGQPYGETQGNTLTSDIPIGDTYDAARANVGSLWRMPTRAEFVELFANIRYINADGTEVDTTNTDKRVTVNGVLGLYIESTINGARLFFPMSGCGDGSTWAGKSSNGFYWSSNWNSASKAWYMSSINGVVHTGGINNRYRGFAVRPVISKSTLIGDGKGGHKFALSSNNKNIFDATLMFGTGNEPSTVEEFEAWLEQYITGSPMSGSVYFPYNAGTILPVKMTRFSTVGMNAGQMEIYAAHLPVTQLTGRLYGEANAETTVVFPDGMKRIGDVYDEIFVEDGIVKAVKRVGSVDLGTLEWKESISYPGSCVYSALFGGLKSYGYTQKMPNILTDKYDIVRSVNSDIMYADKSITQRNQAVGVAARLIARNDSCSTESSFQSAMNGVILYYELETPEVYVLDALPRGRFSWYGIRNNTEVDVTSLPWYVSGQNTDTLVVDAMYGEEIRIVLRVELDGRKGLAPEKVYTSVVWKIPNLDSTVVSRNGGAVRSSTLTMDFDTIMNMLGVVLSGESKAEHLRLNWKTRKSNSSTEVDKGWGQAITLPAGDLKNTIAVAGNQLSSTIVLPYVYLLGAFDKVTGGEGDGDQTTVTDNGETVFDRTL